MTPFLHAANLKVIQYFLSSEGGASITQTNDDGETFLLLEAHSDCHPQTVQWLFEHGGAQITDTNNVGETVWSSNRLHSLSNLLKLACTKGVDGKVVSIRGAHAPLGGTVEITAMLRVMVLHGGPPESLTVELAPPLQGIVQGDARLRARLPAYLAQRRALLDAHCPLLPPLRDLVHGYEEPTTTDELWATELGAAL
jgi:hypothetical protein